MKPFERYTNVKPIYDAAVQAKEPKKKRPAPVSMRFNEAQLAGLKSYVGDQSLGVYCRDYLLKSHNLGAGGTKPGLFQEQIVAAQILRELGLSGVSENLRFVRDTLESVEGSSVDGLADHIHQACADVASMHAQLMRHMNVHDRRN